MNAENKCEICEKVYITKQKLKKHTTLEKFIVAIFVFVHFSEGGTSEDLSPDPHLKFR